MKHILLIGQHSDPRCVYVKPSTGKKFFSFRIAYARCGTKPDLHGQFYENTVNIYSFLVIRIFFSFLSYTAFLSFAVTKKIIHCIKIN